MKLCGGHVTGRMVALLPGKTLLQDTFYSVKGTDKQLLNDLYERGIQRMVRALQASP